MVNEVTDSGVSRTPPTKLGYCIDSYSRIRPEYCKCSRNSEGVKECRQKCENDHKCRGYSYHYSRSSCYLYTVSECTNDCVKGNRGNIGEMIEVKDNEESGCFMIDRSIVFYLIILLVYNFIILFFFLRDFLFVDSRHSLV